MVIDQSAMAVALEKLRQDPEPEARLMRTAEGKRPAYNVQTAVDAECGMIVAQAVTTRFLLRGRHGAQTEISLATLAYNLKRMMVVPGGMGLRAALAD